MNNNTIDKIDGDVFYRSNNQLHRMDGPAIIWKEGQKEWYQNGERHRLDGPAIEYVNGNQLWAIHGKQYNKLDWENIVNNYLEYLWEYTHKQSVYNTESQYKIPM